MLAHEALIKLLSHKWKAELTVNGYRRFLHIKSIIITTNLGFDKWNQIFTDKIIAAAIVDRLYR